MKPEVATEIARESRTNKSPRTRILLIKQKGNLHTLLWKSLVKLKERTFFRVMWFSERKDPRKPFREIFASSMWLDMATTGFRSRARRISINE